VSLNTCMKAADVAGNSTRMVEGQPTCEFMTRVKAVECQDIPPKWWKENRHVSSITRVDAAGVSGYSIGIVEGQPTREFRHSCEGSGCVRILHRDGGRTADT
jgi:hypothetical protein